MIGGVTPEEVSKIQRRLTVANNEGSEKFAANMVIKDSSSVSSGDNTGDNVTIGAIEDEYDSRYYGPNQKWGAIAPRPGTSQYAADRGGFRDLMHILVIDVSCEPHHVYLELSLITSL